MLRKRGLKSAGVALVAGLLMGFDAILHPKGARMEDVQDETRRRKVDLSGEPVDARNWANGASSGNEE
jgi:hypothetical protein